MLGSVLIFKEGHLEKSGKMDKNREFPCYTHWEVRNSRQEFWQIPDFYLFLNIQLQFYCFIRKSSLKSENLD